MRLRLSPLRGGGLARACVRDGGITLLNIWQDGGRRGYSARGLSPTDDTLVGGYTRLSHRPAYITQRPLTWTTPGHRPWVDDHLLNSSSTAPRTANTHL